MKQAKAWFFDVCRRGAQSKPLQFGLAVALTSATSFAQTAPSSVEDVGEGALGGVTAAIGAGLAIFGAIFVIGVAKKALHTAA